MAVNDYLYSCHNIAPIFLVLAQLLVHLLNVYSAQFNYFL